MAERRVPAKKVATVRSPIRRRPTTETAPKKEAVSYFASGAEKDLPFISSGCKLLDEALGGGWVLGRMVNLVGDKSSGKTLMAIEACANFHISHPSCKIRYAEAEAAFDEDYAEALGMPIEAVEFTERGKLRTIEDWYKDLTAYLKRLDGKPGLYVLDSLDALSDDAEMKREIDDGSFGASKPKKVGELFRRLVQDLEQSNCLLIIISQLKDKIGVTFGETKTRSGGKAMDYYATHIVWLAQIEQLTKEIRSVKRVIGVKVRAKVKKNKVGLPFREADFPVLFGYGIDDLSAGLQWLVDVKLEDRLEELGMTKAGWKVRLANMRNKGGDEVAELRRNLNTIISKEWGLIENEFLPKAKKY